MRRFTHGELLSAVSATLLAIAMFALQWFGVDGIPGRTARLSWTENAWHGLSVVRWIMLLTIVVAIGAPVLHATQRTHGAQTDTSMAVAALGGLTAVLLVFRVLIDLPSSDQVVDQKLGAMLGMLCSLGVALGGFESLREARAQRESRGRSSRRQRQRVPS